MFHVKRRLAFHFFRDFGMPSFRYFDIPVYRNSGITEYRKTKNPKTTPSPIKRKLEPPRRDDSSFSFFKRKS